MDSGKKDNHIGDLGNAHFHVGKYVIRIFSLLWLTIIVSELLFEIKNLGTYTFIDYNSTKKQYRDVKPTGD